MADPTYADLLKAAQEREKESYEYQGWSSLSGLGSTFSNFAGTMIDYSALKTDASNLYISAGQVELQAKQRANQLREQFIQSAGSYMMSAANRGIAVQSGSVQSNLERSAENLGKDIQKMESNASLQAKAYITQAEIARQKARTMKRVGVAQGINSAAQSIGGAFYNFGKASDIKTK